jgi:glutamyl-tRNA synthetase
MRELIYPHAIRNASQYGKADTKAVLSKVLAEKPELRMKAGELTKEVELVVKEVNSKTKEEITVEVATYLTDKNRVQSEKVLEDLPGTHAGGVKLRFAPNPSGPLHIGHARAAILNDEYAKKYKGELVLRFEDTDPRRVDIDAYNLIRKDLDWLGVGIEKEILQSDRFENYYDKARVLFKIGGAYLCTCPQDMFKKTREVGKACVCRDKKTSVEYFDKMFNEYGEGEAVLRVKTDLGQKNSSLRDFPIMRIVDSPHPLVGDKKVYPLMNFSVAVDDHDLGLTHILRGKDHILNTHKQGFIFDYFGWKPPSYTHYGLLKIKNVMLSTSDMKQGILNGNYTDWDDPRLGTLLALRRRGIKPDAVRRAMLNVGVKPTDISFSWKNLYAFNKEIIDPNANRYSFVESPVKLAIKNSPKLTVKNRLHPTFERGIRTTKLKSQNQEVLIGGGDFQRLNPGDVIRLMGAYNIEITQKDGILESSYHSLTLDEARSINAKLINWVNADDKIKVEVLAPGKTYNGFGEADLKNVKIGEIVQFERFGFVRIDQRNEGIIAVFTHK